jgi:hypothetical protein
MYVQASPFRFANVDLLTKSTANQAVERLAQGHLQLVQNLWSTRAKHSNVTAVRQF